MGDVTDIGVSFRGGARRECQPPTRQLRRAVLRHASAILPAMAQDRSAEQAVAEPRRPRMGERFEALYYEELLHRVNPTGDIGLLTLWSPLRSAKRRLDSISPEILDGAQSRIAIVSNLYGDGMYAMFCNLLFNPQVRHLVAIGEDLGLPTCREIEAFLSDGLEDAELLGTPVKRIAGTDRVFSASPHFDERRLRRDLSFSYLGKLSSASLERDLSECLRELPLAGEGGTGMRVRVEMAGELDPEHSFQPSDPGAHQVVRRRPLDCWEELVARVLRFGRPVTLGSGSRLELLNVKTVITEPAEESAAVLAEHGFSLSRFRDYQQSMLRAELPKDTPYTYGNRLRGHFDQGGGGTDTLQTVIERLGANPHTRHAYIALWDTAADLPTGAAAERGGAPCLVTLAFRVTSDGVLALTASYRAHNLLIAWLENVYGLIAIQRHVAGQLELATGPITVFSHSLGVDPRNSAFQRARALADRWKRDDDRDQETGKYSLREDPNGYFVVSVDRAAGSIVAEHRFGGVLVKRYAGPRADGLASEISADMAVSLASHAIWLGVELARKEAMLGEDNRATARPAPAREEGP